MIDTIYILVFLAGIVYGIVGILTAQTVEPHVEDALIDSGIHESSLWGLWALLCVTLLWPVLVGLIALTTGYATLSGVSE